MTVTPPLGHARPFGRGERVADLVVHAIGVPFGVLAAIALMIVAGISGGIAEIGAALAYVVGMVAMLSFSAAYNLAKPSPRRAILRRLDHAAIFVMIAGTYTPVTVIALPGGWAWSLSLAVWIAALGGVAFKLFAPLRFERLSIVAYLAIGWLGVLALNPLLGALDPWTLGLIGVGGLLYSAGTLFHIWSALPGQNAIWHGFVLAAVAVHYAAVMLLVLGVGVSA
jgi:hemolysin III